MKTIIQIGLLFVVAFLFAASAPQASARGISRPRIGYVRPYVAPTRALNLFSLGTVLSGPRYYAPRVIFIPRPRYCY